MAGELVVADYQMQIRDLLIGPTTPFHTTSTGWGGLGLPAVKTQDVELDQADGKYLGPDLYTSRILTFPIGWGGSGPASVMTDFLDLISAWSRSIVDLDLYAQLPGWGKFYVTGRPRGLVEDLSRLGQGEAEAILTFETSGSSIEFVGS